MLLLGLTLTALWASDIHRNIFACDQEYLNTLSLEKIQIFLENKNVSYSWVKNQCLIKHKSLNLQKVIPNTFCEETHGVTYRWKTQDNLSCHKTTPKGFYIEESDLVNCKIHAGTEWVPSKKYCIEYPRGNRKFPLAQKELHECPLTTLDLKTLKRFTGDNNGIYNINLLPFGPFKNYFKNLEIALLKIPKSHGISYHGGKKEFKFSIGEKISFRKFLSTSKKINIAKQHGPYLLKIEGQGHNISQYSEYPDESEVVYLQNVNFEVVSKTQTGANNYILNLKEIISE